VLLKLLRRYALPYRRTIALIIVLQLVGAIGALLLPRLNADLINNGVVVGDTGYILERGGVMLLVSLMQVIATIAAVFFGSRTAMAFGRDVRSGVFFRVSEFSAREVAHFGAPSLITRNTNDVQQVQMLVMVAFNLLFTAPIMMVGGIIMAVREDVGLSWLVVVAVPLLGASVGFVATRMVPGFRLMQERIDRVNEVMREQITGIRVVRAFVRERVEEERFARANHDLTDVALFVGRWMASLFPIVMLIMNASTVAVIWFGGLRVDSGAMEIGSLTAYLSYLLQILMSVMMATMLFMMLPRATVSANRIGEVLETEPTVKPPENPVKSPEPAGRGQNAERGLRFERVGFKYPGAQEPVLHDIGFEVRPGETVAVIGSTGSGKTTLVNLVPRLIDATEGAVLIDGVDVRDLEPDDLWSKIGLVPQKAYLFSGTVADNLRYGKVDATEEEIWEALEIAQAKDFVSQMPEGLDAPIAQGGTNVSGGQRQRLAIARALIKKPDIYVFDDSFSALDVSTDARLRKALEPETRNAAVLIVAQRVATIMNADRIIVLEDGRIVGMGSHEELLDTSDVYREIVQSQQQVAA